MALSIDSNYVGVKNAAIAVFLQVLSSLLSIIGIVQMRKAYSSAGVDASEAADYVPWETALVAVYCVSVTAVDVSALRYITSTDTPTGGCWGSGIAILHFFLWFCSVFFGLAVMSLALGYVVIGLEKSQMLEESDMDIFYGLSPNDIIALNQQVELYMNGAWMLVCGTFLSIPPQGWLISAAAVVRSSKVARETHYKPSGSGRWTKPVDHAVYYNSEGKKVSVKYPEMSDPLLGGNYETF